MNTQKIVDSIERNKGVLTESVDHFLIDFRDVPSMKGRYDVFGAGPSGIGMYKRRKMKGLFRFVETIMVELTSDPYTLENQPHRTQEFEKGTSEYNRLHRLMMECRVREKNETNDALNDICDF